ncbi:MAG TPA: O-antigen ligase family protein [Candidatus Paceibacterota bacterium]
MDVYKKIFFWIIKGGLFLIPFIPLYVSRSLFFPYITGKAFIFRTIVEIVFFAWIFLAIFYPEYRPRRTALFWSVIGWLAVVTLASIFGENPLRSFWSNFERMEGLAAYLHLAAYFVVLGSVFKKSDWMIFFSLFAVSGLVENFYALFQWLGYLASPQGGLRVDGTIGNPTYLAAYLIFILAFSLFLFFEYRFLFVRLLLALSILFTLTIIYFTATRGATIAILGGLFLGGILYLIFAPPSPFRKKARVGVVVFLIFVLVITGSLWFLKDSAFVRDNSVLSRLTSISLTERTVESRFKIWVMGWEGFKEHPILGWGPENYNIVFAKYFNPELWRQEPWFDRSHNVVLDWLINAGILGLLSFLAMLFCAAYSLWQGYCNKAISFYGFLIFFVTLAVYFVQNLFVFDQIATYISLFAIFAFAQAHGELPIAVPAPRRQTLMYAPFVLVILAIFAASTVYVVNGRAYSANRSLLEGLKGGNIGIAFSHYQKALSSGPLGRSEATEQFVRFALTAGGMQNVDSKLKDSVLRRAIEVAEENVAEHPQDPRAYLFLGNLYQNVGMLDKAIEILNQAIVIAPRKQQVYFELADAYMRRGSLEDAIRAFEEAYMLAPDFNQAQINLAVGYIVHGDQEKADALFLKHYGVLDVPEIFLARVYAQMADRFRGEDNTARARFYIDRLIGIRKALLANNLSDLSNYTELAKIYLIIGRQQDAGETLNAAIAHNNEWKDDIEQFLKDLGFGQ